MTILISDNSPRISYTATAGQTVFTVPFEFFDNSDLNVFINDVLKTITTDYTVTGGNGSTGTVTLVTGATVGDSIVITRKVTLERVTDFPTSGPFQVASLNIELDKLVAMVADLQDLANRGLRLSDSDITERLTLASTNERKGTVLAFNATTGAVEVGPTIADTNTVAQIKADISTVAGISANVTTVAGISGNVTTVAGISSDVTTVAGQTTNMQNITDNLTDIQNASTNATNAATSASNAASSETAAASSASSAATSEANAATSETNAATSASSAASSASTATTKASEAATSATNAATSETNAATSATNAATSESNAGNSAASALASEGSAAASASNAAISETNSATSATDASNSAISAANSAASAAAAFDNFDDTYLGSFATDPTTDNDGDPLVEGALYFNSTSNEMRVYDGANWIAASSSGAASMLEYNYTATASQTTFSGADDNSATLSYTADNIIVTLNGVVLENGTDYTATDGTSIVLTTGAALDDELNIIAFKSFTVSDTVAASTGGTFNGSVAVNGDLTVDTDTLFVDSTNNRVGIGTTSPDGVLEVSAGSNLNAVFDQLSMDNAPNEGIGIEFSRTTSTTALAALGITDTDKLTFASRNGLHFYTGGAGAYSATSEVMRIDSSGNVLVGATTSSTTVSGHSLLGGGADNGIARHIADGIEALQVGRLNSDGVLVKFYKDGTTVGTIGTQSGRLTIGDGDTGLRFADDFDNIQPFNTSTNAIRDNAIDLGSAAGRFDDIFATNGTIQTSDRNEKQDIEALSEAEQRVAVAAKGLLKKFRWINSVEEKGDDARIHFGIIAQDLQAAFEAEGLDAGRYAMFTNSTWVDEETGEERSRMGVRYNQLLAFIVGAM